MKKEHFMSAIGYDGLSAVIDKKRYKKNRKKNIQELLEEGYYRSAAAIAIYDGSAEEQNEVVSFYNKITGSSYTPSQLPRLFGVAKVDVKKLLML